MTARLSAAESFLTLLDNLAGSKAKPNGATAAVLLHHAAETLRDVLEAVDDLRRELADNPRLFCGHGGQSGTLFCSEAPHHDGNHKDTRATGTIEWRDEDVPRPERAAHPVAGGQRHAGPGHTPDLSHLPPRAGADEIECGARSPDNPLSALGWVCTAGIGHPERWHAMHTLAGTPHAVAHPDAAWPVTDRETGLPPWAEGIGWPGAAETCGAALDRWVCNAVPDHAPADHVTFGPWDSRMPGAVLARWASVRPTTPQRCLNCGAREGEDCQSWCAFKPQGRAMDDRQQALANVPTVNGHALRPPEWECSRCSNRFSGRKPEDGMCAGCGWPKDGLAGAIASLQDPATEDAPFQDAPEPVIDPDCRDGKCGSCVGGPCQHDCHTAEPGGPGRHLQAVQP